ncbi:chromosome segregation protein [Gimesia panareensis]|uniref:Chromosome segregation protein n=1 Tax=Gimesia panareensis TaxID=2527978 RepID=A0A517QES3_9PLAN|nr:DUF4332 domain-containing protein [Gimesia panareensis]QDT30142.1 chromosome segregation protein [Gimesia panareensis]
MKINRIHVDRFGNWHDLNLAPLQAGINVFYGPNETGKSTLMRMIRGILYGFRSEEIREHVRVPDSTPWSALLDIKHQGQRYEIRRQSKNGGRGQFSFQAESRGISSQELLTSLHAGVKESVYENVFAIGLNELQELGTLHGDQVARHIYGLSLGPEGQAILDVSRHIAENRQTCLSHDLKSGSLVDLYRQLDEVNAQLANLQQQSQRFYHLSNELQQLREESDSLKKRKSGLQYQIRGHRFLERVFKPWQEVQHLHQKLKQLPVVHDFPVDGIALLDDYDQQIRQTEAKLIEVKAEIKRLRKEIEQYESDNELLDHAAQIQSLADQKDWIASLEQDFKDGQTEVRRLEQILEQYRPQNLSVDALEHIQATPDNNQRLIQSAREYRAASLKRKQAHQRYKKVSRRYQKKLAELQEKSGRLLNGHSIEQELQRARERMQHLERLSQLRFRESEFSIRQEAVREQLERLQTHSRIPGWAKKTLFGFAIAGTLLLLAGIWRGVTDATLVGVIYCLTGLFLGGITWAIKKHFEIDVNDQAEELQDENWALDVHLRETRQEIDRLLEDEYFALKLVKEGHSLSNQRHREQVPALNFNDENILRTELLHDLAFKISELEQLQAAQAQVQKTRQRLVRLRNRSQEIQREFSSKRHEWCECLKQLGLTETLKIEDAFRMWHQISNASLYATQRAQEQRRIKPLGDIVNMFYRRVRELGLKLNRNQQQLDRPFEVVTEWERELELLSGQRKERARLRKEEKRLREEAESLQLTLEEIKHQRSSLLIQGGAANREEFLQRASAIEDRLQLEELFADAQAELEQISRSEQEMAIVEDDLLNFDLQQNTEHLEMLNLELEDIERDLVNVAENMGRLKQDYQHAKTDRSSARLRFRREQIQEQIRQAGAQWFSTELSAVGIAELRSEFERTSQPETLAIASDYLRQLTNEKYTNIWTPLGEQFPKIDDDEGHTLTVDELSSGTREQLFLAIRLAMVERFRNQGVQLPMILDDVLVNFDQERTRAAIKTLNAVAAKGQQILLFTCHLHLTQLFEEQGITAVRLPASDAQRSRNTAFETSTFIEEDDSEPEAFSTFEEYDSDEEPETLEVLPYELDWSDPLDCLSGLSAAQIQLLTEADIWTIQDLLSHSADEIAGRIPDENLTAGLIFEWQSQARLAACIRGLAPPHAILLVSCGITEPEEIASLSFEELWSLVQSCQDATENQHPVVITETRVEQWILGAQQARAFSPHSSSAITKSEQAESLQDNREYRRDDSHSTPDAQGPNIPPFYLDRSMPVEDAPSIGPKTAERLEAANIFTVKDLLECNPQYVANKLNVQHIRKQTIRKWIRQTTLVCCIPGLRGHDAQILEGCGLTDPATIGRTSPQELLGKVNSFLKTKKGQRILRDAKRPDLDEVTDWVRWSQKARELRAA